jgi:UDP-N-acetylglucosamine--N-acetylmuramyl-(pentapeptide) pyrophosphoryl-undecaprenol N-acetylglucosamine transferase
VQVVHLAGRTHAAELASAATDHWRILAFEERMERFFAAVDLVVSRAGGAVAELSATGTPAVLVPGGFGSAGHQAANAAYLQQAGAAVVVPESAVDTVPEVVASILGDPSRLEAMRAAARSVARPDAAQRVAAAMMAAHG